MNRQNLDSLSIRILRALLTAGAAAVLLAAPTVEAAATASGTLTVTTTVTAACAISNGLLAFGNYDPTSASATNGSTTLTLTCTPGTAYNIGLDAGSGSGATITLRQMTNAGTTLGYKLFRDSGRTLNWGTTIGTDTLSGTSSASSLTNTINVYGLIPAGESATAGAYTDTVAITVTY